MISCLLGAASGLVVPPDDMQAVHWLTGPRLLLYGGLLHV